MEHPLYFVAIETVFNMFTVIVLLICFDEKNLLSFTNFHF